MSGARRFRFAAVVPVGAVLASRVLGVLRDAYAMIRGTFPSPLLEQSSLPARALAEQRRALLAAPLGLAA